MAVPALDLAAREQFFARSKINDSSHGPRESEAVSTTTAIIILTIFGTMILLMDFVPVAQRRWAKKAIDTPISGTAHENNQATVLCGSSEVVDTSKHVDTRRWRNLSNVDSQRRLAVAKTTLQRRSLTKRADAS